METSLSQPLLGITLSPSFLVFLGILFSYMNAEKYNLDRIYFGGCFIRGHKSTISTLSYAIRFWSRGTKRAFFLRHEGYLGAIGAWLRCVGGDEVGVPVAESSSPSKEEAKKPEAKSEPVKSASTSKASSPPTTTIPKTEPSHQLPSLLQEALGGSPLEGFSPHSKLNSTTSTSNNSVPQVRPQVNGHARTSEQNGIASERTLADLLASLSESDKGLLSPYLPSEVLSSTSTSNSTPMTTSSNLNSISSATTQTTRGESVEDQQEDEGLEADEEDLEMMDPNQLIQIDGETFSVKDLLAKMEMAEGAADGLEDKLDSLLGRLDGMLEGMGINGNDADESLRG